MRKPLIILVISSLFLTSCSIFTEADEENGDIKVFEVILNFNAADNFETVVKFPDNIEVGRNHVLVVSIFDGMSDGLIGDPEEIWEELPYTIDLENGDLTYGFKHTQEDITFYLDGFLNLKDLKSEFTQDIKFKYAFVPDEWASSDNLTHMIGNADGIIYLN